MTRTIAQKMFIKLGARTSLDSAPDDLLEIIQAPVSIRIKEVATLITSAFREITN